LQFGCDIDFCYDYREALHLFGKIKVSSFDLKLCPHQGISQTSLFTKFKNFWTNYPQDIDVLAEVRLFM
jgi:hypothetical protein